MDLETKEYLDNAFGMVSREFQRLHQRIDGLEQRMDALERRVHDLETRTDQGFVEVSIRFKSVEGRLETLAKSVTDLREQMFLLTPRIAGVESRLGQLVLRTEAVERAVNGVDERVSGLAADVGQRFRGVNDRLAALAN